MIVFFKEIKVSISVYFQLLLMWPRWCFWFTFAQGHLSRMTRVGWRTGSLLTVPPRWSKQTNVQGRGKGRWKVIAVPAANRGRASAGGTFPSPLELRTSQANWSQSDGLRGKLSLRFDGKSGSSANCVFNQLLPANNRKTSWASRGDCFFSLRTKVEDLQLFLV